MMQHPFEPRLSRFSAFRRRLLNAALAYRYGAIALGTGAVALVLLAGWLPGAFLNLALAGFWLALLTVLAVRFLIRRERFRSWLDEAFHMELLAGNLNSRLVSAWDFLELKIATPLTNLVIDRAKVDLQTDFESKLDRTDRDVRRKWFAIALAVFVIIGLTPWFGFAKVADNLRHSWLAARDYLFPVQFVMEPAAGRHIHRLGEKVDISLQFARRGYRDVTLVRQSGDEPATETSLPVDADNRVATQLTSDAEAEYSLHFAFGERRSDEVRLVFTTAPTLVNMQTELIYPTYTAQLPRQLEGVQQRLLALPGTRITIGFTFSKDLETAGITWDDGQELPLETVGRFASITLTHNQARQAKLQVRDVHGLAMDYPLLIDFELQNDEKPQLFTPRHLKEDMPMLPDGLPLFGFGVRAQDDYGVTRCLLRWQKSTVDSPTAIQDQGEVERIISPSQRNAVLNFEKIFEGLALKPGDKLSFDVEVYDNRAPDKQVTRSRKFSLFIYQQELDSLSIKELGFGQSRELAEGRIAKSTRATTVKAPEGLRSREQVWNEFQGTVNSNTQTPAVRGEFGQATQDYFRLLSKVPYQSDGKAPPKDSRGAAPQAPRDEPPK